MNGLISGKILKIITNKLLLLSGGDKKMDWNYDIESCPLDTKVCLLSAECPLLPQMEYIGTITFNGRFKVKGECFSGDPDCFYRSAIVAWKQCQ